MFDNGARRRHMDKSVGSRILAVDPVSRDVETLFESSVEEFFFTSQMGKQQPLPNGNILLAEADGGRVIEVDPAGEIVWEYVNRWSASRVALMTEGLRLPPTFFNMPGDGCQDAQTDG